jgi:integrase
MSSGNIVGPKKVRALAVEYWPAADRKGWEAACKPSVRLQRGGAASHLRSVSTRDFAGRYGVYFDFLQRHGRLDPDLPAGGLVTPDNVEAYINERKECVTSVTLYNSIYKLRRACQLVAPGHDVTWLVEIENDLAFVMTPRSKVDRLVLSHILLEAGLALMVEAKGAPDLSMLARARQYRNGLMVALLALIPIRLKNFAALEIGRTFVEVGGKWWIVLPGPETKEKRYDEKPVDDILAQTIGAYLSEYRPALARKATSSALWLSSHNGRPMSYSAVEKAISATTLSTVGVDVSPHLFRMAGGTTAALLCGSNPHLASALLHHADPRIQEEHYNKSTSLNAAIEYQASMRKLFSE